jgi:hypothetical protein
MKYSFVDLDGIDHMLFLEDLKKYNGKLEEYEKNVPKLYRWILQYLSNESLEAVKKDADWSSAETIADPEVL